jgi:hypothetical protein
VVFFNRSEKQRSITATFDVVGLSSISKIAVANNVWTNVVSNVTSPLTVKVEPHGVLFLILMPDRYSDDELVLYSSLRRRLQ